MYLVLVENINGKFYLTPTLKFSDGLGDNCIWENTTKETILNEIKEDSEKFDYEIICIEEVEQ